MNDNKPINSPEIHCKNCDTQFHGKYCPECGQSVKEFERPIQFLIMDFMGNMFAFDTRFWKTLTSILFKPGALAQDYVIGRRARYMPPFRFYVFVSFVFFLLLNFHSSRSLQNDAVKENKVVIFGDVVTDTSTPADSTKLASDLQVPPPEADDQASKKALLNEHPELFYKQLLTNLSWGMFLLMPLYGLILWLFYRKSQKYYVTHFIMAVNQHAFMFVVLILVLLFALALPDFSGSFRNYFIILIPIYFAIGHKNLYRQKTWKTILKLLAISILYFSVVFAVAIALIVLVVAQNGISLR